MSVKSIPVLLFFQFELYVCLLYLFKSTHLFHIIVKAYTFATRPVMIFMHGQFLLSLVVLL